MSRVALLLTVLLGVGTDTWAQSRDRAVVEYTFLEMELMGEKSTDPDAFYEIKVQSGKDRSKHTGGIDYSRVQSLMKHFKVRQPSELVGKKFSTKLSPAEAIEEIHIAHSFHPPKISPPDSASKDGPAVSGRKDKELPSRAISPATSDEDPRLSAGQAD